MLSAACAIGALILRSATFAPHAPENVTIVETAEPASGDVDHPANIFSTCPSLLLSLPLGVRGATEEDRFLASRHVPSPTGPLLKSVFIYSISRPIIEDHGERATVSVSYECSGLCGGGLQLIFLRRGRHWKMEGQPRTLWVS